MPATLFGRFLAALLGVVALTFAALVVLVVRERQELAFWRGEAADIVSAIDATSDTLAALSPAERDAEIARLRAEPLALERGDIRPFPPVQNPLQIAHALRVRLARALGAGYRVSVQPASRGNRDVIRVTTRTFPGLDGLPRLPGFAERGPPFGNADMQRLEGSDRLAPPAGFGGPGGFGLRLLDVDVILPDGGAVTFRTDLPRPGPRLPRQIFVELALLTIALGAVLFVMARTVTRPLGKLAAAAEAVGRGERRSPLPETGVRELRDATRAFNTMQERLHRYLDSRTRVLAAMSHDLRTPLTRLRLRVEALDDDATRERFSRDLDEMSAMVEGALKLFKGANDDEPIAAVHIDALLTEIAHERAEVGEEVVVVHAPRERIAAKPQALKRCLTNLVSNAVKYGARATLDADFDGGELVVRVRDEGPGLPEEDLERVFEPFFRLEGSRNADTGGVGLGLSIARDIAQAHGGSLVLRNRTPHGLEALLRLPRGRTPERLERRTV